MRTRRLARPEKVPASANPAERGAAAAAQRVVVFSGRGRATFVWLACQALPAQFPSPAKFS